jgi:hypothetical protein
VRTFPALITEAIEIGARVLDREQAEANAEWMKAEFEKSSREIEASFVDKAKAVAEFFDKRVDQVFGPENGQLQKELARLFGDGSSEAVQHQLRQVMARPRRTCARTCSSSSPRRMARTRWPTSRRAPWPR